MESCDNLRRQYQSRGLERTELGDDPFRVFDQWFRLALETSPGKWLAPNAMTLSTSADGRVTSRTVLLKAHNDRHLTFFTNYQSEKGRQLTANPNGALLFHWPWLSRQVRITGPVQPSDRQTSRTWFESRPRDAQLAALASEQSTVLESRDQFEQRRDMLERQFADQSVPLPDQWGGYHLQPREWEFWQGREDRAHDRFRFRRDSDPGGWTIQRLAP